MQFSRHFNALAFCLALSPLFTGCSSKPTRTVPTATQVPVAVNLGRVAAKAFEQIKASTPLEEDAKINARIICVADAIIRDRGGDWEIAIFHKDLAGAFVLPGGKIGVYSGLTRLRNQDQVAAIVAHGVAHALAKHPEQRVAVAMQSTPQLDPLQALAYPRSADAAHVFGLLGVPLDGSRVAPFDAAQEAEAESIALDLLIRSGFEPSEYASAWRSLEGNSRRGSMAFIDMHPLRGGSVHQDAITNRLAGASAASPRAKPDCDRIR